MQLLDSLPAIVIVLPFNLSLTLFLFTAFNAGPVGFKRCRYTRRLDLIWRPKSNSDELLPLCLVWNDRLEGLLQDLLPFSARLRCLKRSLSFSVGLGTEKTARDMNSQSLANLSTSAASYCGRGPLSERTISGFTCLVNTDLSERIVSTAVRDAK